MAMEVKRGYEAANPNHERFLSSSQIFSHSDKPTPGNSNISSERPYKVEKRDAMLNSEEEHIDAERWLSLASVWLARVQGNTRNCRKELVGDANFNIGRSCAFVWEEFYTFYARGFYSRFWS